jgi:flagellar protein FliS
MIHDRDVYLETQVLTATPQKLRLMLIEGAIRFARGTAAAWERDDPEAGLESLIRCRDVVGELISGIQADTSPLARQVVGIYLYLFTSLTGAQLTRDQNQLAAAIGVLEEERDTWRAVCEQWPDRLVPAEPQIEETAAVARTSQHAAESLCLDA